jgi:hypothetical protein
MIVREPRPVNASSNICKFPVMRSFQPRDIVTRCVGTFRSSPVGTHATAGGFTPGPDISSLEMAANMSNATDSRPQRTGSTDANSTTAFDSRFGTAKALRHHL